MGKKYTSEFTAIDNKDYRVDIELNSGSGTVNFTLGGSPFVTEMSVEDKQMYSPVKGSSATCQMVVGDYYFDLYSESATGTKITLTETTDGKEEVRWFGYVTPQMFNQGFTDLITTIEIEALDALSVLENINFKSEEKNIESFLDILKHALKEVDIRYMYVSNNMQLSSPTATDEILTKLKVSEQNFFDNKDSDETDDDVCWNCLDVVSEVCQFLGYVAIMIGQDLWLLDYDAIRNESNQYYRYDLSGNSTTTLVNISHSHHIVGDDYAMNDASVSLDCIYNKISVKADVYNYDEYANGNEQNITRLDNSNFSSELGYYGSIDYIWGEVFPADDDQSHAMDVWIDAHSDQNQGGTFGRKEHNYFDFTAMKFLKKENHKFYIYDTSYKDVTSNFENFNMSYPDWATHNGGIWVKYFTKNLDNTKSSNTSYIQTQWNNFYKEAKIKNGADSSKYLDFCLNQAGIHGISWTEALIMNTQDAYNRYDEKDWYKIPYYEIECQGALAQGGDNTAMLIKGQFYWHLVWGIHRDSSGKDYTKIDAYPMEYDGFKLDKPNWIFPNVDMFVPASIQWGNYWWNGEEWQTTKCGFKLNWLETEYRDDNNVKGKKETIDEWKCQNSVMQAKPLTNNIDWRFGTDEQGCMIKIPSGLAFTGKPKLTIYRPVSGRVWKSRKDYLNGDNNKNLSNKRYNGLQNGIRYPWFFVALIGLEFKAIMGDPSYSDANDTDTIYTNLLENDSSEELDQIDFKIHTFDDKNNSWGSVVYDSGSDSLMLDKVYNRALHSKQSTWTDAEGNYYTNGMRAEEHYIFRLCNQYTSPSKILQCQLNIDTLKPYGLYTDTTLSDKYIVGTINTDYHMAYDDIKLIEKKS